MTTARYPPMKGPHFRKITVTKPTIRALSNLPVSCSNVYTYKLTAKAYSVAHPILGYPKSLGTASQSHTITHEFTWCEKGLVSNRLLSFCLPEKVSLRSLLDGIGMSVKDGTERLVIESSGDDVEHSEEDTINQICNTSNFRALSNLPVSCSKVYTYKLTAKPYSVDHPILGHPKSLGTAS
ncbi:unnamed protein product [Absidia cylindrospora]